MDVNELFEELESIDYSSNLSYERAFRLFNQISVYPIFSITLKKGSRVYRTRTNIGHKQFNNTSELSYPPEEFVNGFSRTNRPRQSFLYTSNFEWTTYMELHSEWTSLDVIPGDVISATTIKYITKEDILVSIIPDFRNMGMKGFLKKVKVSDIEAVFLKRMNSLLEKNKLDPHIYIKTSAFFNAIRINPAIQDLRTEGLIYTSVPNKDRVDNGWNLVLSTACADRVCSVEEVFKRDLFVLSKSSNEINLATNAERVNPSSIDIISGDITWN